MLILVTDFTFKGSLFSMLKYLKLYQSFEESEIAALKTQHRKVYWWVMDPLNHIHRLAGMTHNLVSFSESYIDLNLNINQSQW